MKIFYSFIGEKWLLGGTICIRCRRKGMLWYGIHIDKEKIHVRISEESRIKVLSLVLLIEFGRYSILPSRLKVRDYTEIPHVILHSETYLKRWWI